MSKLVGEVFVDWSRVIAPRVETPAIFDAEAMVAVIKRAIAVSDADAGKLRPRGLRLSLRATSLGIESGPQSDPDLIDEIEAEYQGLKVTVGLMSRYLSDAITALGGEGEMELHVSASDRPVRLCRRGEVGDSVTLMVYRA